LELSKAFLLAGASFPAPLRRKSHHQPLSIMRGE